MIGKYGNYIGEGEHIKNNKLAFGYVSDLDIKLDGKLLIFMKLTSKGYNS